MSALNTKETRREILNAVLVTLKNIVLLMASPVIALAYLFEAPIVSVAAIVVVLAKAVVKHAPAARTVALTATAPVIALAALVAAPALGLGTLAWIGVRNLTA